MKTKIPYKTFLMVIAKCDKWNNIPISSEITSDSDLYMSNDQILKDYLNSFANILIFDTPKEFKDYLVQFIH